MRSTLYESRHSGLVAPLRDRCDPWLSCFRVERGKIRASAGDRTRPGPGHSSDNEGKPEKKLPDLRAHLDQLPAP